MARQAPVMSIVPHFELPSEEVMSQLDVSVADFGDFAMCLKIISNQADGMSLKKAAETAGVPIRTLYEKRWQEMMHKAQRVATGFLMTGLAAATAEVYEEWPAIIHSIVMVAKTGQRDHEKVAAAEFLHHAFIEPIQSVPQDDSKELAYMKKPKNFNPLTPIQVNEGGTVIIHNGTEPNTEQIIEVKAT